MTVSLCIIAYNEENVLESLLSQVKAQTFPHDMTELVLVDSGSDDDTKKIFLDFSEKNKKEYMDIKVLDNPKRSQAAGWNTAIRSALGDVIIRLDAHAEIPADFIEKNMELIGTGEDVCGGSRPNRIDRPTPVKEMLFLAESFSSTPDKIQEIIEQGPIAAGISRDELQVLAKKQILKRTSESSAASFVAGIPGGWAMAATIPADVMQFFGMALRLAQELSYLAGYLYLCINVT